MADGAEEEPGGWDCVMRPEDVVPFAERTIAAAGWSGDGPPVVVVFDVDAEAEDRAGYFTLPERAIHLDPRLATPFVVLHEVAHFVDWRDEHGPRFVAILYGLLRATYGADLAEYYLAEIDAEGCPVDWEWIQIDRDAA